MNWYAVLPILVFGGPAAGFLWELAVGLFCRTRRYLLWVPVLAGALGLALCAASPVHTLPFSFLLLCWGLYGGGLLFGWSLSHLLRGGEDRFQRYAVRAVALCSGAALAIGFGVLISHEMRSATYTMVGEDISEERVLAEIPELAITETDREILSALGASPSVQAAVAGGEPFIDLRRRNTRISNPSCQNFWTKGATGFPTRASSPSPGRPPLCITIFSTRRRMLGSWSRAWAPDTCTRQSLSTTEIRKRNCPW